MRSRLLPTIVAVVLAIVVLWLAHRFQRAAPHPPRATPEPKATMPLPSPAAEFSPTPEEVEHHTRVVVSWRREATPTPSPSPPREEPTPRPGPSPTPELAQCLAVRYSTSMIASAPGQVLVDIQAENKCGRDLEPLDVWFWVAGYRQGDLIQSVRGHPFDAIPKGGDGEVVIALPGSIDWYDHIEVRVVQPDRP